MHAAEAVVSSGRDLRIDLARSLCLWFILVDHMQGNLLGLVTLRNVAVCDAADVFVFLCGVSASLAYGGTFDRKGWWSASKRVLSRVWTLYLAQLALLATLFALIALCNALGYADAKRFLVLKDQAFDAGGVVRLVLLLEQPGDMGLLPLYMLLLSWFALILPLINRPLLLLALAGGLWTATHLHLPGTSIGTGFNPLAWQLTFTLGVLCCRYAHLLRHPRFGFLDLAAIGLLAAGACAHLALPDAWSAYDQLNPLLRAALRGIGKRDLDPGRVLSVLALAWLVFRYVPRDAAWLRSRWPSALAGLGQQSLPVFAAGVILSSLGGWALLAWQQSFAAEVAVNAVGIAGLMATARLARLRLGGVNGTLLGAPARGASA